MAIITHVHLFDRQRNRSPHRGTRCCRLPGFTAPHSAIRQAAAFALRFGPAPPPSIRARLASVVCLAAAIGLGAGGASAQNISRTITIDGDMADWYAAPDITNNPGQYSEDCAVTAQPPCEPDTKQSTGRDLKKFAYTWDVTNLYLYVERYGTAATPTSWLFYVDENTDGKMQTGEGIVAVRWLGNTRRTSAEICRYTAVFAVGDSIRGDGHTMPGGAADCRPIYSDVIGGATDGQAMEAALPWAELGADGPKNVMFHISSSRGTDLPGQVEDNMNGPGGREGSVAGQLFPPDMALAIVGFDKEIGGFQEVTFSFELRNIYYDPFTEIEVSLDFPAELEYVRDRSPPGSTLSDVDGDGLPDLWAVDSLRAEEALVLEIDLRARAIPFAVDRSVSATLSAWTGLDSYPDNNHDKVMVHILPSPDLIVVKSANTAEAPPGATVVYAVLVTNTAHAPAHVVLVQGTVSPHIYFGLETFGAGQPFRFTDGTPVSTLTFGAAEYSADGGATWGYLPTSGAGGAPAGFDGNVTHWRVEMLGVMETHGANFEVRYAGRVR